MTITVYNVISDRFEHAIVFFMLDGVLHARVDSMYLFKYDPASNHGVVRQFDYGPQVPWSIVKEPTSLPTITSVRARFAIPAAYELYLGDLVVE